MSLSMIMVIMLTFLVEIPSRIEGFRHQLLLLMFGRLGSLPDIILCMCVLLRQPTFSFRVASKLLFRSWSNHGCLLIHLHFWNILSCILDYLYQPNALVCKSEYSKIGCIYLLFHLHCTWFHVSEETKQLLSLLQHVH